VPPMKRDMAERMAATAVDGVSVPAGAVIREFLTQLARCPACDGSGTFTFPKDLEVEVKDRHGSHEGSYVPSGATSVCPLCMGEKHDPAFVAWHCVQGRDDRDCRHDWNNAEERNGHAACGWKVMLPLPEEAR